MSGLSDLAPALLLTVGAFLLVCFAGFAWISTREREQRAARWAFFLAIASSLPFFLAMSASPRVQVAVLGLCSAGTLAVLVLWLLPIGGSCQLSGRPSHRVDERDIMFARARLEPGSQEFNNYYSRRPEHRESDDRTRSLPGLLSSRAPLAEPLAFGSAKASFDITEALRDEVDGPVAAERVERPASEMAATLKDMARRYGAVDAGITQLQPYHIYTHVGRGTGTWGQPIELDHRWAIAFTVEMDHATMRTAPAAPVVAESARQYVESARIGVQLAALIRSLGYPARAHIDGNYRVIAPLVAHAAGLGEIGRMGLLMTPRLGPRVRIGVVTTNLPLVADQPGDDTSALDFCSICNKCATNCPVGAIPNGDRTPIGNGLRWAIDSESCFRYWNVVGTDCATCMKVCPYSHPDNPMHSIVRKAIRISPGTRSLMLWADDLVYGRKP